MIFPHCNVPGIYLGGSRPNHLCGKVHRVTVDMAGVDQNITGTVTAWYTVVLALQT